MTDKQIEKKNKEKEILMADDAYVVDADAPVGNELFEVIENLSLIPSPARERLFVEYCLGQISALHIQSIH